MRRDIPADIADLLPFPLFSSAAEKISSKDIVSTVESTGQLATLMAALEAAGLVETLKGVGPHTLFAPTDAAFAKLTLGAVEALFKPENNSKLVGMLKYHVVAGDVKAAAVMTTSSVETLNGQTVTLGLSGRTLRINDTTVVKADIAASNGTLHIIDNVLLPAV